MERRFTTHHWDRLNKNTTTCKSLEKSVTIMNNTYEEVKQTEANSPMNKIEAGIGEQVES